MNFDAVITQLRQHAPIFDGRVAGAAALDSAILSNVVTMDLPAAYVVPLTEDAEENQSTNALKQLVTEHVAVVVEFCNKADRRGQTVTSLYDPVRAQIWAALLNWQLDPERASRGLEYGGGQLLETPDRARLFYQWTFHQELTITAADGWQVPTTPLLEIDLEIQHAGRLVAEAVIPLPQS